MQKKIYTKLALCLFLCFTEAVTNAQVWDWTKTGPNGIKNPNPPSDNDDDAPYELATDAQGFVYALGDYNDSLYLNNNFITKGFGSYLAKYDAAGNLIWYRLIRRTGVYLVDNYDYKIGASDMVINASGIFIVGHIPELPFNQVSSYAIGDSQYTVDTTGSYIYGATAEFFICKLNWNGGVEWNKTSRNAAVFGNYRPTITSDNNNNIIVSGFKFNRLCGTCGNYQTIFYTGTDPVIDNTGRPYTEQVFILKYDSNGTFLWSKYIKNDLINGGGSGIPVSLACDNSNNIWLYASAYSGSFFDNIQFTSTHGTLPLNVLTKLNSNGNFQFVKEIATLSINDRVARFGKPQFLAFDNADNLYALVNLSNQPNSFLDGSIPISNTNQKIYLLKYSNEANLIWYKTFGGRNQYGDDYSTDIKFYNNALWYTGSIRSSYSFPDTSYFNFNPVTVPDKRITSNFLKFFAAKSDTAGNFNWVTTYSGGSNVHGLSIAPTSSGVYTSGSYRVSINDLGSLGGSFINPDIYIQNQFLGKLKDQYIRIGAFPTQVAPDCKITIPFTAFGLALSGNNRFIAELSDATGDFTTPTQIGSFRTTGSGAINATIPSNLPIGTTGYKIRIRSTDTLLTGFNYYAYADAGSNLTISCLKPTNLQARNITSTSARLSWTPPANCVVGFQLQYKPVDSLIWITLQFGGNNRTVTGLLPGTTYEWRVQTGCRQAPPIGSGNVRGTNFTTAAAASIAVLDMNSSDAKTGSPLLYPNPVVSTLNITMQTKNTGTVNIRITDVAGRTVFEEKLQNSSSYFTRAINLSRLSKGTYIIELSSGNEMQKGKFVKE